MTVMQDDWARYVQMIENAAESKEGMDLENLEMSSSTTAKAGTMNVTEITIKAIIVSKKV